jgi:hypothetical protein
VIDYLIVCADEGYPVRLNVSVMVQCFSLTTKQHQPAYQSQKPSAEQVAPGL